jgi:Rps23 Pro-64 3,4-dihydroxylase Tpa1-like proline 4-hydroxylase
MDDRVEIPSEAVTTAANEAPTPISAASGVARKQFEDITPLLVTAGGLLDRAEEALKRSLEADPRNKAALGKLGIICRSRGNLSGALDAYGRLAELDPDDIKARYVRSVLSAQVPSPGAASSDGWPAPFVRIEQFLAPAEHDLVLESARAQEGRLEISKIGDGEGQYNPKRRSSWVLFKELDTLLPWFLPRVKEALPTVLPRLQVAPFPIGGVELQMTVHRSGGFYKIHQDTGKEQTRDRLLSYVYYFHRLPKRFTGGDLLLYDTDIVDGTYAAAFTRIEALDNSIVFFPSVYCHQVTTVHGETDDFGDSRFTLNGWFHAAAAQDAR